MNANSKMTTEESAYADVAHSEYGPSVQRSMKGAKCLLVASTGGHLSQLNRLASAYDVSDDSLWLTFENAQSTSLLKNKRVEYVPYIEPRDWRGVLRAALTARRIIQREDFQAVVSTGAGLALAALPQAAARGIDTLYVESVSRVEGPSLTGRLLARNRRISTYTQHGAWAGTRWKQTAGVLATFSTRPRQSEAPVARPRLFVTLGTIKGYRFDRMIDGLLASGLCDENTVWQVGETSREDLPGRVYKYMGSSDFSRYSADADVVVTHSGVGTIVQLLEQGVYPVVVPRSSKHREHVDDHQWQIARHLEQQGIASVASPEDITRDLLLAASLERIVDDEVAK